MFADRSKIARTLEPLKLGVKIGSDELKLDELALDVASAVLEHMVDEFARAAQLTTPTSPSGSQTAVSSPAPSTADPSKAPKTQQELSCAPVGRRGGNARQDGVRVREFALVHSCEIRRDNLRQEFHAESPSEPVGKNGGQVRGGTLSRLQRRPRSQGPSRTRAPESVDDDRRVRGSEMGHGFRSLGRGVRHRPVRGLLHQPRSRQPEQDPPDPRVLPEDFVEPGHAPSRREGSFQEGVTKIITSTERHDALARWMPPGGKGKGKDNDGKGRGSRRLTAGIGRYLGPCNPAAVSLFPLYPP